MILNSIRSRPIRSIKQLYRRVTDILVKPDPLIERVMPFTMLTPDRLRSLLKLSFKLVNRDIPGVFVECGTCRGGSAAILAYAAKQEGWKRDLYLFDSFKGHPDFASNEAPDRDEIPKWAGKMVGSQEDVKSALRSVDAYDPEHVNIVPGWFQDSLLTVSIPKIALLHIDADWYDSVLYCLEVLYDKIVTDGYIVIDDYGYNPGCRLAVEKFISTHQNEMKFCFEICPARVYRRRQR